VRVGGAGTTAAQFRLDEQAEIDGLLQTLADLAWRRPPTPRHLRR